MSTSLLSIDGLDISFASAKGETHVLAGVHLDIDEGSVVGLVGESGSGKSTLALALLGLLPRNARIAARTARFAGADLSPLTGDHLARLRGDDIAIIFQDPMTALNPSFTIGSQLVDAQRRKRPNESRAGLWERARHMLDKVGIPDAAQRLRGYPHEFSGGMRQRVMIAMALLAEPRLLIADEPTTALDATIETQIVEILRNLKSEISGALLVVSHSLGLIAELCDRVVVMYAGTIVETGEVREVLSNPRHPYTKALLACEIDPFAPFNPGQPLTTIKGGVPDLKERPHGCIFASRCDARFASCTEPPPFAEFAKGRGAACWLEARA